MNLDFLAFHNYYDRVIEKFDTRADYSSYRLIAKTDIQFNPNDGIATEVILEDFSNVLTTEPDYVLVWETVNNNPVINSRWFIMEIQRLRGGQWKCTLRRDAVSDYYSLVLNTPCFVQKGNLKYNDPFIFNDEGMTFNQIKKTESLLKDVTQCPWLVAYVAQYDNNGDPVNLSGTIKRKLSVDIVLDTPIADTVINTYCGDGAPWVAKYTSGYDVSRLTPGYMVRSQVTADYMGRYGYDFISGSSNGDSETWLDYSVADANKPLLKWVKRNNTIISQMTARCRDNVSSYATASNIRSALQGNSSFPYAMMSDANRDYLLSLNQKIVKDSTNHFYEVHFYKYSEPKVYVKGDSSSALYSRAKLAWDDEIASYETITDQNVNTSSYTGSVYNDFYVVGEIDLYRGWYMDVTDLYYNNELDTCSFNTVGHIKTLDAPYNIIALPYIDGYVKLGNDAPFRIYKEIAMSLISTIAQNSLVYDAQLLPYCPFTDFTSTITGGNYQLNVPSDYESPLHYTIIQTDNENEDVGVIFNCPYASFRTIINAPASSIESIEENAVERKIKALTRFTRLCSPNYSGVFQFNKQKNNGLQYFEINCTYKPFLPYIHINPNFGGLYGKDFDDNRGLICQGEFSLPIVRNEWTEYQLQNKNFQNLFNRQIDNMEVMNKIAQEQFLWNAAAGMIQGAGTGAAAGAMVGGGIGAAIGAPVGAAISGIGAYGDAKVLAKSQAETMSYTKDVFSMNLQNIQARPNTLTRVGTFDIDNKIFPFVEEYECTSYEENALRNKLKYSGMTIGRIDTIAECRISYASSDSKVFVQGELILVKDPISSSTGIHMDSHMATELYKEVLRGIRI